MNNTKDIISKAARLAESVLMSWDESEQIELAKEVAVLTHEFFNNNSTAHYYVGKDGRTVSDYDNWDDAYAHAERINGSISIIYPEEL